MLGKIWGEREFPTLRRVGPFTRLQICSATVNSESKERISICWLPERTSRVIRRQFGQFHDMTRGLNSLYLVPLISRARTANV